MPLTSKNERYKTISYGVKSLVKVEKSIEDKLIRQAKRYNKIYLGQMLHVDTKIFANYATSKFKVRITLFSFPIRLWVGRFGKCLIDTMVIT
ncbi:hypothetical protein [Gilliamella intestini]|uniref:hypothetical protein n=1 Tax=Gilliamella intestini TaxID=1798183 RepID=UPI00114699F9|nr:hypothetical protein [Gilliamella intestini]